MFTRDSSDRLPLWHRWLPWALLGLALWVPLPFGSNRPWVWHLPGVVAGIGIAATAYDGIPARLYRPMVLFVAVLAWMVLQALPVWPQILVAHFFASGDFSPLALQPVAAVEHALRLASVGGIFFLGFVLARTDDDGAARVSRGMAVIGVVWAVVSIISECLFPERLLLLWPKEAYVGALTGPFVNRNAAACFFGLVCLVVVGHGFRGDVSRSRGVMMACFPFVAVLLTGSRGGLAATVVALLVLLWLRHRRGRYLLATVPLFITCSLVFGGTVTDRWAATDLGRIDRLYLWQCIVRGLPEHLWSGVGGGGFDHAFAGWRDVVTVHHWDRAHCLYLEHAAELGIPAFVVLSLVVLGQAWFCLRRAFEVPSDPTPAVGFAAFVLVAVHGLVDFAPQIPANSVWVALLLGLGCGAQGYRLCQVRCFRQGTTVQGPSLVHRQGLDE